MRPSVHLPTCCILAPRCPAGLALTHDLGRAYCGNTRIIFFIFPCHVCFRVQSPDGVEGWTERTAWPITRAQSFSRAAEFRAKLRNFLSAT